jgi:hypothetical protein
MLILEGVFCTLTPISACVCKCVCTHVHTCFSCKHTFFFHTFCILLTCFVHLFLHMCIYSFLFLLNFLFPLSFICLSYSLSSENVLLGSCMLWCWHLCLCWAAELAAPDKLWHTRYQVHSGCFPRASGVVEQSERWYEQSLGYQLAPALYLLCFITSFTSMEFYGVHFLNWHNLSHAANVWGCNFPYFMKKIGVQRIKVTYSW